MMDKLIREGKLSQKSFFYRNFCEVAKHLDNPNSRWDPEICEALMSIKHLGGRATMNHVVGPLGRGQGSQGRRDAIGTTGAENCLKPVLNYGDLAILYCKNMSQEPCQFLASPNTSCFPVCASLTCLKSRQPFI